MAERYIHKKEVIQSKIGDEVVMLDMDSGFYFGLNSVASVIWNHLKDGMDFNQLVEKLMEQFEVDRELCVHDTKELLNQMVEKGIISQIE